MEEQRSPKPQVGGSNPSWPVTKKMNTIDFIKKKYKFLIIIISLFLLTANYYFNLKKELKIFNYSIIILTTFFICNIWLTKKIIEYLKESKNEIKNITWPEINDAKKSSLTILLIVLITSIIIWILDSILTYIITYILKG